VEWWTLAVLLVFLSACSQLATVRNVTPTPPSVSAPSGISLADKREADRKPASALSRDLDVASYAWTQLKRDPANLQAQHLYNYSVGRIVSLLQATGELPRAGAVRIGTASNTYLLTYGSDIKYVADPRNCHFVPADELALSGKDYSRRVRRDGIGAPVLVRSEGAIENARAQFLTSDKLYYGMTAVLEFKKGQVKLIMKDPLASDQVVIDGRSYPLAAYSYQYRYPFSAKSLCSSNEQVTDRRSYSLPFYHRRPWARRHP